MSDTPAPAHPKGDDSLKRKMNHIHEALDKALNPTTSMRDVGIMTIVFPYAIPGVSYFSCNSPDRQGIITLLRSIADQLEKDPSA